MPELRKVDIGFVDTAEVVLTTDVDLPASVEEVWAVLVDNESWPRWLEGCSSSSGTPAIWTSAGDTRTLRVGPLRIDEVAVAIDEPNTWAMCLVRTNLPMARAMLEMLELIDTSRNGEMRTEVRWTGAIDRLPYLRPLSGIIEARLADLWGQSLEALYDEVVSRR